MRHHVRLRVQGHYGLQRSPGVGRAWVASLTASLLESCSTRSPGDHCPPGRAGRWNHEAPGAVLLSLTQAGAGCTEEAWVAEVGTEGESCVWDLGTGWGLETALLGEVGAGDEEVPPSLKGHFQGH